MKRYQSGFTLVELLVVIAIIGVLTAIGLANYVGVRERATDSKKKLELKQMKNALRLYYNDYGTYPSSGGGANLLPACGALDGTLNRPISACVGASQVCNGQFATVGSVTNCDNVYMKRLPASTDYAWTYTQRSSGDDFVITTTLSNQGDPDITNSQTACTPGAASITPGEYQVCAD